MALRLDYNVNLKKKLRALVADSDGTSRVILAKFLTVFGVKTEAVDNGRAVLDLISCGASFDLICLDRLLPQVEGPKVIREIRAMGVKSKILGIDSFLFDEDEKEFINSGADECMGKPYDIEKLVTILKEIDDE